MMEKEIVLENETGLHARAASLFVKEASRYVAEINVEKDGRQYNAKSIMGIISMGAAQGEEIRIIASGEDEKEAVEGLVGLINRNFKE